MFQKEVKIVLLGDSGVGKSSILIRFINDEFRPNMDTTVGAAFLSKNVEKDNKLFRF